MGDEDGQIIVTVFYDSYGHLMPREIYPVVWLCVLNCRVYADEITCNNKGRSDREGGGEVDSRERGEEEGDGGRSGQQVSQ